ncbi:hypothetical protein [Streptodolium elevatio]
MAILRLVLRRLVSSVPLLFTVSTLTFALVSLVSRVPGDPARTIVGQHATEQQYAEVRDQLGLDHPLPAQYWNWLERVTGPHPPQSLADAVSGAWASFARTCEPGPGRPVFAADRAGDAGAPQIMTFDARSHVAAGPLADVRQLTAKDTAPHPPTEEGRPT